MRHGARRETALLFTGSAQVSINVRNGRHPINCDFSGGLPGDVELLPEEQAITAVSEASGGSMLPCRKPVGSSQAHTVSALFSGGERLCSCLLMADGGEGRHRPGVPGGSRWVHGRPLPACLPHPGGALPGEDPGADGGGLPHPGPEEAAQTLLRGMKAGTESGAAPREEGFPELLFHRPDPGAGGIRPGGLQRKAVRERRPRRRRDRHGPYRHGRHQPVFPGGSGGDRRPGEMI